MRRGLYVGLFSVAFILLWTLAAAAELRGRVVDEAGQAVVNAYVTLRSEERPMAISVLTNGQGQYVLPDLLEGAYTLQVRRYGYEEATRSVEVGGDEVVEPVVLARAGETPELLAGNAVLAALPAEPMKFTFITGCTICHDMGSPIAGQPRDFQGWVDIIEQMREQNDIYSVIVNFDTAEMARWLVTNRFGESPLPLDPFATGKPYVTDIQVFEYAVGDAASWAHDMAVEPETGAGWVGDYINDVLIRIDPETGAQTEYPLPVRHAGMHTLNFDREGRLWFTLQLTGQVGVFEPNSGAFKIYDGFGDGALTHSFAYDSEGFVQKDASGRIWVSQFGNNSLASLDPETGAVKLYRLGGEKGRPYGIALSSDGRLWYTKYAENLMGVLDPDTGKVKEWPLPRPDSGPHRMHIDDHDRLWIPLSGYGSLLRYDIQSGTSREYLLPDADTFPYAARYDGPTNTVWVNGNGANALYRLDLDSETFDVIRLPSPVSYTRMVSMDHRRNAVWTALSSYPNGHALRDHGVVVRIVLP